MGLIREVYIVDVQCSNMISVTKTITKRRVARTGPKWIHCYVGYGERTEKYESDRCFINQGDAEANANALSDEIVKNLIKLMEQLAEPADFFDATQEKC